MDSKHRDSPKDNAQRSSSARVGIRFNRFIDYFIERARDKRNRQPAIAMHGPALGTHMVCRRELPGLISLLIEVPAENLPQRHRTI